MTKKKIIGLYLIWEIRKRGRTKKWTKFFRNGFTRWDHLKKKHKIYLVIILILVLILNNYKIIIVLI